MSEEVRPFEEYKEMIQDMRKEEMIKGLYDLSARVTKQENIIKEAREYITYWHYRNDFRINSFTTGVKEELLEILDKGE